MVDRVESKHGQAAGRNIVNNDNRVINNGDHVGRDKIIIGFIPPTEEDPTRVCPQCRQLAWKYTSVHQGCGYDLAAHDQQIALEMAEAKKQKERETLMMIGGVVAAVVLCLLAFFKLTGDKDSFAGLLLICFGVIFVVLKTNEK